MLTFQAFTVTEVSVNSKLHLLWFDGHQWWVSETDQPKNVQNNIFVKYLQQFGHICLYGVYSLAYTKKV